MTPRTAGYRMRPAMATDLPRLREIERAAGEAFNTVGMEAVAADDPPSVAELAVFQSDGRCWVFVDADDRAIAYLVVDEVDGCGHIEQVSIHPEASGNGLGRRLLDVAGEWAAGRNLLALTLTTFVDVPWNGPYYVRCGFRFLDPDEETPGLRAVRAVEAALGLDRWPRSCMRRELLSSAAVAPEERTD